MTEATTLSLISHWFSVCKCMKLKMSANVNYRADLGLKLVQCFCPELYHPTSAVTLKTASSLLSNKNVFILQ